MSHKTFVLTRLVKAYKYLIIDKMSICNNLACKCLMKWLWFKPEYCLHQKYNIIIVLVRLLLLQGTVRGICAIKKLLLAQHSVHGHALFSEVKEITRYRLF